MTLNDGSYSFSGSTIVNIEWGTYTTEKDKITFTVEDFAAEAKGICGEYPLTYSYYWTLDVETQELSFKEIDDQCSNRLFEFTYRPWTYSKGD